MRFCRHYVRQILNIALCVVSAVLCGWIDNPILTIFLWSLVALINLEWAFVEANKRWLRRFGGWMKW